MNFLKEKKKQFVIVKRLKQKGFKTKIFLKLNMNLIILISTINTFFY